MRFLVNENIPRTVIDGLRARGPDVVSAKESMRSEPDEAILARAQADGRGVVTQDKDFGEWAYRRGLPAACGVVLFRLSGDDPDADTRRMLGVLKARTDWEEPFAVVTDDRVRVRPLPDPGPPVGGGP